jgi:hypothetical protein
MKMLIMDHTGHTVEEFDTKTKDGLAEAMARFEMLVKEHKNTPAKLKADGNHVVDRKFDPNAEEYLFVTPLKGG